MPRVSTTPLSATAEEKIKNIFLDELVRISDKKQMASFFGTILTDSEKIMLAKRLVAFVLIDQGLPDEHISRSLHLTRETVTRFRLIYSSAREKQEPMVQVVQNVKSKLEFKKLLKELVMGYVLPAAFGRIPKRGIF